MMVEPSPMWMGMLLPVSREEKESLLAIMWFEAPESMSRAMDFEVLAMRAWPLSCWYSRSWFSFLQKLSRRFMLFISRREVASSSFFFMQACLGWKPFPQYEHLTFSFPWWPLFLFFFNPEGSSCSWFWTLGLGALNLVFWVLLLLSFTLQIFGPWDIEGLITGGSDDPHLDKIIMFTC